MVLEITGNLCLPHFELCDTMKKITKLLRMYYKRKDCFYEQQIFRQNQAGN